MAHWPGSPRTAVILGTRSLASVETHQGVSKGGFAMPGSSVGGSEVTLVHLRNTELERFNTRENFRADSPVKIRPTNPDALVHPGTFRDEDLPQEMGYPGTMLNTKPYYHFATWTSRPKIGKL